MGSQSPTGCRTAQAGDVLVRRAIHLGREGSSSRFARLPRIGRQRTSRSRTLLLQGSRPPESIAAVGRVPPTSISTSTNLVAYPTPLSNPAPAIPPHAAPPPHFALRNPATHTSLD